MTCHEPIAGTVLAGIFASWLCAPAQAQQLHTELVVSGLVHPVAFIQDPAQTNVQFVVEQGGRVRPVVDGELQPEDFLDLSGAVSSNREGGLLGLAFAPDYDLTGRFFVNFTDEHDNTVIARFTRDPGDPLRADPNSRFDLVWPDGNAFISQPYCCHYGGNLVFGPDGYLYVAIGDGGAWDDPDNNAQNPQSLLGKMLRLDVSVSEGDGFGYAVPWDNPFVGQEGVFGEIWDAGLRNPWRYSFDDPAAGGTGALILADVGQDAWEEFDYEPPGAGGRNYGWRNREGANEYLNSLAPWFEPLTDPTFQYPHDGGRAIIGGYVYRGRALDPDFLGRYFFGDFMTGQLWSVRLDVDQTSGEATAADLREHTGDATPEALDYFTAFGRDAAGELYVTSWWHGTVYRLVPGAPPPPPESPDVLLTIDAPTPGAVDQPFSVSGWSIDRNALSDSGVDYIEIWAKRTDGVQSPFLIGRAATVDRPDVASILGPQFAHSGYNLQVRDLQPATYEIIVYAHSETTQKFAAHQSVFVDVRSGARIVIDQPLNGARVGPHFTVSGWTLDAASVSGSGVDAVHVWAFPSNGDSPIWVGVADYGGLRLDVAAVFGNRFSNVGFSISVGNLSAGTYRLMIYARSKVTGRFDGDGIDLTVEANLSDPAMALDVPAGDTDETGPFTIGGWAADLGADAGSGVDAIHVWAFSLTTQDPPLFLGQAAYGGSRPDVGAILGAQFTNCGFTLPVSGLPAGSYEIVVFAHSAVTHTFNQARIVRVRVLVPG